MAEEEEEEEKGWSKRRRCSLKRSLEKLTPRKIDGALREVYGDGVSRLRRPLSFLDINVEALSSPACDRAARFLGDEPPPRTPRDFTTRSLEAVRRLNEGVDIARKHQLKLASTLKKKKRKRGDDNDEKNQATLSSPQSRDSLDSSGWSLEHTEYLLEVVTWIDSPRGKKETAVDEERNIYNHRHALVGHFVAVRGNWWRNTSRRDESRLFKCEVARVVDGYVFLGPGSKSRNKYATAFELYVHGDSTYSAAVVDVAAFIHEHGIDPPDYIFHST